MSSARSGSGTKPTPASATKKPNSTASDSNPSANGGAAAGRRRLGRGLSSLLNEAIAVSPPAVPAPAVTPPSSKAVPSPAPSTPHVESKPDQTTTTAATDESRQGADVGAAQRAESGGGDNGGPRVVAVPVDSIVPCPFQPRRVFEQEPLERLAASIRTAGVMQPILVRRAGAGAYELVAGERRWRAARLAGLAAVPAIVAELGDEQAAEWALIENVQREELGAMERALALRSLIERFGLTHAEAADKVGLDRSSVSNLVRLTDLEEPIRALLEAGKLGVGHGKALLAAPAGRARVALAERAAAGEWSVRRLEQAAPALAKAGLSGAVADPIKDEERRLASRAQELGRSELERQLGEHLGTKVQIKTGRGGSRGRLIVEFYDLDQFDGLMSRIGFQVR